MEQITFEEFGIMLDEIVDSMPKEIFVNLNGGVNLLEDAPLHPESVSNTLFVLGRYYSGGRLGRYINIYYGSFMTVYGGRNREFIRAEIDRVLRHEFMHHLESMAGEKDLEMDDAIRLAKYKRRFRRVSPKADRIPDEN